MFKVFKIFHFLGLTLFLGSIWVYITEGTPMNDKVITSYVRNTIVELIQHLTLPGLVLMIVTGLGMVISRPILFKSTFFKIKLLCTVLVFLFAKQILSIAKQSAMEAAHLPEH